MKYRVAIYSAQLAACFALGSFSLAIKQQRFKEDTVITKRILYRLIKKFQEKGSIHIATMTAMNAGGISGSLLNRC